MQALPTEVAELPPDITDDGFLGGRIKLLQPKKGYRAGLDAVFLAASVPCEAGQRVFEAGMGVGTAALCLVARVPGVRVTGVELSPLYAGLARANIERNSAGGVVEIIEGDVADVTRNRSGCFPPTGSFDHVIANPPYHAAQRSTASPSEAKARAHSMDEGELGAWIMAMAAMARPRGTISIVQRPEHLPAIIEALGKRAGDIRVAPLFPRPGAVASLVIVQGIKGSRAGLQLLPGLVLHGQGNGFTDAAEAVLRHGDSFLLR